MVSCAALYAAARRGVLKDSDIGRAFSKLQAMPIRSARAYLIAPRVALAPCVRAYIVRNTIGADLQPHERYNHFPATPACTITWAMQGSAIRTSNGQTLPGPIVFGGPHTMPTTSYNPGPVHALTMVVMPDALRAMTGVDAGRHVNELTAAHEVFDADWLAMLRAALQAPDDAARVQLIEDFITPRWQAVRGDSWTNARTYRDWAQSLALRAAMTGVGRSVRQGARRIRAWAGLPLRTVQGLSRAEASFLEAQGAIQEGRLNWADVAHDAGYADQSHLCRESRRVTGLSPQELLRRIQEDESFWVYRVWE